MLQSYFRSGWAFLIPYLAAYLLYAWLDWPVNPNSGLSSQVSGLRSPASGLLSPFSFLLSPPRNARPLQTGLSEAGYNKPPKPTR